MAKSKANRAYRPTDVDVDLDLVEFARSLARATGRDNLLQYFEGELIPGEYGEGKPSSSDPEEFAVDYLWQELFSKFDDGKSSAAKSSSAIDKFHEAEMRCGRTNSSLSRVVGLPSNMARSDIEQILCLARRKIREVLGRLNLNHIESLMGHTGGASFSLARRHSFATNKISGTPETTYGNLPWCQALYVYYGPSWSGALKLHGPAAFDIVEGNRVTTVPKNFKCDRIIAIEPRMNMYVQKGFGNLIRKRLRDEGVDLDNQEVNRDLARVGAACGFLSTLDLSSASDTVSLELVRFLLPHDWCMALEQCRSPVGVLPDGTKVLYRKFSSMGNGYTFELESLIFYSLAWACNRYMGEPDTSFINVYGDDIIVPVRLDPLMRRVLDAAGFVVNARKSFSSGPFRESCGKHYHGVYEVSPFYVRRDVRTLGGLFLLHNKLYRWYHMMVSQGMAKYARGVSNVLVWLRSIAPKQWRVPKLPDGFGDGAFIGTFDEIRPSVVVPNGVRNGWDGYVVRVLLQRSYHFDLRDGSICVKKRGHWSVVKPASTYLGEGRKFLSLRASSPERTEMFLYDRKGVVTAGWIFLPRQSFSQWLTPLFPG